MAELLAAKHPFAERKQRNASPAGEGAEVPDALRRHMWQVNVRGESLPSLAEFAATPV